MKRISVHTCGVNIAKVTRVSVHVTKVIGSGYMRIVLGRTHCTSEASSAL